MSNNTLVSDVELDCTLLEKELLLKVTPSVPVPVVCLLSVTLELVEVFERSIVTIVQSNACVYYIGIPIESGPSKANA